MAGFGDSIDTLQGALRDATARTTDAQRELREIRAREEYDAVDQERKRRERLVAAISETPEGGSLSAGQIASLNRMRGIEGDGVQNGQIMSAGYNPKTGGWRFAVAQDDGSGNIRPRQHEIPRHELYGMMSSRPNMFSEEQVMRLGSQIQSSDSTYTTSRLDEIRNRHALSEENLRKRYDDAWRMMADMSPSFGRGYRDAQAKPERFSVGLDDVKYAQERIAELEEKREKILNEGGMSADDAKKSISALDAEIGKWRMIEPEYIRQRSGNGVGAEKPGAGAPGAGRTAAQATESTVTPDAETQAAAAEMMKERKGKNGAKPAGGGRDGKDGKKSSGASAGSKLEDNGTGTGTTESNGAASDKMNQKPDAANNADVTKEKAFVIYLNKLRNSHGTEDIPKELARERFEKMWKNDDLDRSNYEKAVKFGWTDV